MVRQESLARQRLIFHFCETCKIPVRHANKSGHKNCIFKSECTYLYCLTCKSYKRSTEKVNTEASKAFIEKHTPCAQQNGRKGINLTSKAEKRRLERLFQKERPMEGVLSQVDEPTAIKKPIKSRAPKKAPKSRQFIDDTLSDFEVSSANHT